MRARVAYNTTLHPHSFRFGGLLITQDFLTQHRLIHLTLLGAVTEAASAGYIDPVSLRIIRSVSFMCTFPVSLLSLFCLRWSELDSISLSDLYNKKRLPIYQFKTKRSKMYDNTYLYEHLNNFHKPFTAPITICTYDYARTQIAKARTSAGLRFKDFCQDETHIFRHLTASWLNFLNCSQEEIAKRLGHESVASNDSYIHSWDELVHQ